MAGKERAKRHRILIVEDDWDILEVLKLMLEYEGHSIVTAKHGRLALAAAASKPFDMVLMDISMPEMSGIEVGRALRAQPKTADILIAIHTGLDESWVHERFPDYDLFLTKAADPDVLVQAIAAMLAQPRASRALRVERGTDADNETFTLAEVTAAQHALHVAMGLQREILSPREFVQHLGGEIAQLRKLDRSYADIAALLSEALGRYVAPAMLESHVAKTD